MNLAISISTLALLTSVATFLHGLYRGVTQAQLELAKARADLLTQLVELKLEYQEELREFTWLHDVAQKAQVAEANGLPRILHGFKGFVDSAQAHYDGLMATPRIARKALEEIRHRVEALRAMVKSETSQLQQRKEQLRLQLESSQHGKT